MIQLHQIKPFHRSKKGKVIGRGGKKGTYSGRGIKGQKSRAGRKFQPAIRELIKKYHKLRGYKFKILKEKPVVLNLGFIEKKFKEEETINPKVLLEKRLIRKIRNKIPTIKILAKGEIKKKFIFEGLKFSKSAKEKIEKIGGIIK